MGDSSMVSDCGTADQWVSVFTSASVVLNYMAEDMSPSFFFNKYYTRFEGLRKHKNGTYFIIFPIVHVVFKLLSV